MVCTVTSGALTSPGRVTDCTKSSYKALSGMAAVPGTDPHAEAAHTGQAKVTAEPRDVAAGISHTPHNGFVGGGKVEAAGICP